MAKKRAKSSGNPPHYNLKLKAKSKDDKRTGIVGKAWISDDNEHITIRLNAGVVLSWRDCEGFYLTLWPIDDN